MRPSKLRGVLDVFCYQVQPHTKGDVEALAKIDAVSRDDPRDAAKFREQLGRPNLMCFGVEAKGDLVGYAIVVTDFLRVRLIDVLVKKEYRRQGYGRALLACIDDRLLSENRRVLEAVVPERDLDTQFFLKHSGARTTELLRSADKAKDDNYLFRFFHPFSATKNGD